MIVADTNLIAYLTIDGERTEAAETVYNRDSEWAAPYLWRSELRNILALYMRQKSIDLAEATKIMTQAESLMVNREFEIDSVSVLELASDSGLSAYDCEFLVLARELDVRLVTCDRQILSKFKNLAVSPENFSL